MTSHPNITAAMEILADLGLPRGQQNERSALTLLALLDLRPDRNWGRAIAPLMGITPIMDWMNEHYGKQYKPNTRETIRRQTMHQFVQAGITIYNPDNPARAVNSPSAVYQVSQEALALFKCYGKTEWAERLAAYLRDAPSLADRFARQREMARIPVQVARGKEVQLSPGEHSTLIRAIIHEFAPRFVPGSVLVYVGDTGEKMAYFDRERLVGLGVTIDQHGKMPDLVIHYVKRNWLLLIESVTSHGPMNGKRHHELAALFARSAAKLVYVTAFPTRAVMARHLADIAWESEVWVADAPTHLIHFNGVRFLGPYDK